MLILCCVDDGEHGSLLCPHPKRVKRYGRQVLAASRHRIRYRGTSSRTHHQQVRWPYNPRGKRIELDPLPLDRDADRATSFSDRTYKYKRLAILAIAIQAIGFLLVAVRWREGINPWEVSYAVAAGFGFGMVLSAQFIGLSASAPKPQLATAIGLYYLCQQFGDIMGVGLAAAFVRAQFSRALQNTLGDGIAAQRVSLSSLLPFSRSSKASEAVPAITRTRADDLVSDRLSATCSRMHDTRHVCPSTSRRLFERAICTRSNTDPVRQTLVPLALLIPTDPSPKTPISVNGGHLTSPLILSRHLKTSLTCRYSPIYRHLGGGIGLHHLPQGATVDLKPKSYKACEGGLLSFLDQCCKPGSFALLRECCKPCFYWLGRWRLVPSPPVSLNRKH